MVGRRRAMRALCARAFQRGHPRRRLHLVGQGRRRLRRAAHRRRKARSWSCTAMPARIAPMSRSCAGMVTPREIRIDHANWLNDGAIYVNDPVLDVSADNDWSQVKVWNIRSGSWGTKVYAVQGFIGPGPAGWRAAGRLQRRARRRSDRPPDRLDGHRFRLLRRLRPSRPDAPNGSLNEIQGLGRILRHSASPLFAAFRNARAYVPRPRRAAGKLQAAPLRDRSPDELQPHPVSKPDATRADSAGERCACRQSTARACMRCGGRTAFAQARRDADARRARRGVRRHRHQPALRHARDRAGDRRRRSPARRRSSARCRSSCGR